MDKAKKEAKRVYNHVVKYLKAEVLIQFKGITEERLRESIGEVMQTTGYDEKRSADLIIKIFDIQWNNLKTE